MTRRAAVVLTVAALAAGGCGGGGEGDAPRLVVSAASSLKAPLTACSREFPGADVRLSFAGSDELAAQIRQGVRPGVYAAANARLPAELVTEDLLEAPRAFATNALVAAASSTGAVRSLADLERPGTTLAIGSASVPVGEYTRELLSRLGERRSRAILANVRSNEPDVRGVVGKLAQGAADAGFVYASDVAAANGRLRAIALPRRAQPDVAYVAGLVKGSSEPEAARAYLKDLVSGRCAAALRQAGFGRP